MSKMVPHPIGPPAPGPSHHAPAVGVGGIGSGLDEALMAGGFPPVPGLEHKDVTGTRRKGIKRPQWEKCWLDELRSIKRLPHPARVRRRGKQKVKTELKRKREVEEMEEEKVPQKMMDPLTQVRRLFRSSPPGGRRISGGSLRKAPGSC